MQCADKYGIIEKDTEKCKIGLDKVKKVSPYVSFVFSGS